ncbi:GIY-YIG nuclease family protein [Caulobacter sp. KR2-114]|uniref:GIY-YIG nuclease family protein n=1 Tax=Caulobacter sp. KR2-114 TaxID=3400912 RepID=UPI003C0E0C9B
MGEQRPLIACYIMSNRPHGTLYIGVTANLEARVQQHRSGELDGFTKRYGLQRLVWYERHDLIIDAIKREKALKRYLRDWKLNLIETINPEWVDLYPTLMGAPETGPLAHLTAHLRPRPM